MDKAAVCRKKPNVLEIVLESFIEIGIVGSSRPRQHRTYGLDYRGSILKIPLCERFAGSRHQVDSTLEAIERRNQS